MDMASLAYSPPLTGLALPALPGWLGLGICVFFIWLGIKEGDMFFLIAGILMLAFLI